MKGTRHLVLALAVLGVLFYASNASAKVILWGTGEKIMKVMDLPDNQVFYDVRQKKNVDVGYIWKRFTLFFIPVWTWDGRFCGYIGQDDKYLIIEEQKFRDLVKSQGLKFPDKPKLPFWERLGGKLALGGVLIAFLGVGLLRRRSET
ncbi:MAG: hypothetical protein KC609_18720 [Myxococcales bacterium]|nr:hypothetical protein [Myxococcales bacterium]